MICNVRIDDRLIHGEVVGYVVPQFSLDKIVVVDDENVKDKARKAALKFGCPAQVSLSFHSAGKTAEILKKGGDEGHRVLLLAAKPGPLLEMVKAGYGIEKITVGNMSPHNDDDIHVKGTNYISKQDLADFKELVSEGVKVEMQFKPSDKPEDLAPFFRSL